MNNEESFGLSKLGEGLSVPQTTSLNEDLPNDDGHAISKEYLQCEPVDLEENLESGRQNKGLCLLAGTSQVIEERSNEGDEDGHTS